MPRAPAQDLVADRRDHRDQQDPAEDHHERLLPADEAERDDRQDDDDDEELRAAARVGRRVLADLLDDERVAGSRAWIVMCSAPWYWKTRRMSGGLGDQERGSRGRSRPGSGPRRGAGRCRSGRSRSSTLAMNSGSRKKIPTPATSVRVSIRAIEPLPSSTPSSGGLEAGAPDEPARPDEQRLVEHDEAADERQLRPARAVDAASRGAPWRRRCGRRDGGRRRRSRRGRASGRLRSAPGRRTSSEALREVYRRCRRRRSTPPRLRAGPRSTTRRFSRAASSRSSAAST